MRQRLDSRYFLALLTALSLWLAWMVARPFASVLFMAAVVAVALGPLQGRLETRLGLGRAFSAALVTLLALLAVMGPLAAIGAVVVRQAIEGARWLVQALGGQGLAALAGNLPEWLRGPAQDALDRLPHGAKELEALVTRELGGGAVSTVGGVLQATGEVLSDLLLFFVALFFLLSDGGRLVEWLKETVPLPAGKAAVLLGYLRRVTVSVLVSTLATSGVQAALAFVGYLVAGVPYAVFFGVATFFASLIPVVGTALVWVPLALLRLSNGHLAAAAFLAVWGAAVVGTVDNVVKPLLMRRGVDFPVGVVFFALLGGLAAFGPVGLVAGPLVVALLVAVVETWSEQ
ncbi:MAG TPA: AI-2E family transporter [Anaeromyxobacteraceae bacterium]|nr:AI-2E family transporter [Anaeromyxobacteraceae bacterium]